MAARVLPVPPGPVSVTILTESRLSERGHCLQVEGAADQRRTRCWKAADGLTSGARCRRFVLTIAAQVEETLRLAHTGQDEEPEIGEGPFSGFATVLQ